MGVFYPLCLGTVHYVLDDGQTPTPRFLDFIPTTARVINNGYHLADTFEVTVDAAYFPFSPEVLRTVAVELYFVQTEGLLTDASALSDLKRTGQFQGRLKEVMRSGAPRLAGIVRQAEIEAGKDGRVVRMQGEDYTYLLSRPWPTAADGKGAKEFPHGDLRATVQALCDEAAKADSSLSAQAGNSGVFNVVTFGYTDSQKVIDHPNENTRKAGSSSREASAQRKRKVAPRSNTGRAYHQRRRLPGQTSGATYWDVITQVVQGLGGVVYVRGKDVIVASTDSLYDAATVSQRLRRMAYGRNIRDLKVQRQMGVQSVPQVKVVCYDPTKQNDDGTYGGPIVGVYPPDSVVQSAKNRRVVSVDGQLLDWTQAKTYVVHGIKDVAVLTDQAKNIYGHLGRHEARVSFSSKDLKDLDGSDMLQLWAGDPVMIDVDDRLKEDPRSKKRAVAIAEQLKSLGWPDSVAYSTGYAFESLEGPVFYVSQVTLDWDQKQGLDVSVECKNYFRTHRDDVSASPGG